MQLLLKVGSLELTRPVVLDAVISHNQTEVSSLLKVGTPNFHPVLSTPIIQPKSHDLWFLIFLFFFYLFICLFLAVLGLRSVRGLSPAVASGGHSSSRCLGLSLSRPLPLRSTGSRCAGSVVVAHGPSCSTACGIFPDQGSNPCPLHWQADS